MSDINAYVTTPWWKQCETYTSINMAHTLPVSNRSENDAGGGTTIFDDGAGYIYCIDISHSLNP